MLLSFLCLYLSVMYRPKICLSTWVASRKWNRLIYVILMLISFSNVQAKDLFEYQWPQESGADWFMFIVILMLTCISFSNVQAKDLFEYQWPQESGADWFMSLSF